MKYKIVHELTDSVVSKKDYTGSCKTHIGPAKHNRSSTNWHVAPITNDGDLATLDPTI
jgi:hypothetical protein